MGDSGVVIDLGVLPEGRSTEAAGPPRAVVVRWWRTAAAALAALLVLSAGGAAPAPEPPLREVYAAPLAPAGSFLLTEDLLVTTAPFAEADRRGHQITAYDLVDARPIWSEEFTTDEPTIGLALADGVLLVHGSPGDLLQERTTAVDLRTGRRRWSVPSWLNVLPDEPLGLVFDSVFAPESRLPPDRSGAESEVHFSADGHAYSEPPIGLVVRTVDLVTGRVRWESPRLDASGLVPAAGDHPTMLLTAPAGGDGLEVRSMTTGALQHRFDWLGDGPFSAARVGDVMAVARSGPDPEVTAYTADLRQRLWSRPLANPDAYISACGPVLCQSHLSGIVVFDPATGETLWQLPEHAQFLATGSRLVELDADRWLLRILDPFTGHTVGDLRGWRVTGADDWFGAPETDNNRPLVVLQPNFVAERTLLGLLDPARPSIRPLGMLPHVLDECEMVRRFMACRTPDGELRVWRYTPPRTQRG